MEIAAIIATIIAAIIPTLLAPWWAQKLKNRKRKIEKKVDTISPDFSKLPPEVNKSEYREAARQYFLSTFKRSPTERELYDMLNKTIIEKITSSVSLEEFEAEMKEYQLESKR